MTKNWIPTSPSTNPVATPPTTGFPFTISVFGDTANAGSILGENPVRANYTGALVFGPGTRTADRWFNTQAFATPPAFTFGNVGRGVVDAPGTNNFDFSLMKSFRLFEGHTLQFRFEFFNAFNHPLFNAPNMNVDSANFGRITSARAARQIQFGLRYQF